MPTVVSNLRNNSFRPKEDGELGEGELYNDTITEAWEEPDVEEEQMFLFQRGDATTPVVKEDQIMCRDRALNAGYCRCC